MNKFNGFNKLNIEDKFKECLFNYINKISKFNINFLDTKIISDLLINYYGESIPLSKLSKICIDNTIIKISLFDKNIKNIVKKKIFLLNLNLNINDDKDDILIYIPPLTQEKRFFFVKLLNKEKELAKISIRNIRMNFKNKIKLIYKKEFSIDEEKNILNKLQKYTDFYINKINLIFIEKKKKILGI